MKLNLPISHCLLFLLALCTLARSAPGSENQAVTTTPEDSIQGVVVEKVNENSKAEKAGLQEGDILLNWTRGDNRGALQSPFDLLQVEIEQAPLGAVKIEGLRGTEKRAWILESDIRAIAVYPNFPPALLTVYREGRELASAGKPTQAAERWKAAALEAEQSQARWLRSWFLFRSAGLLADARQWEAADDAYRDAIEQTKPTEAAARAQIFHEWAKTYERRSDWANAEKYDLQALLERRKLGAETMGVALNLEYLGLLGWEQNDLTTAEEYYRQSLLILNRLVPGSIYVASCLGNLGIVYNERGDLAKAEEYYRRSLTIEKKFFPETLYISSNLSNLGLIALNRGDLTKAEDYEKQALAIVRKVRANDLKVASILTKLGEITLDQGNPAKAEEYYQQSLVITEKLAPDEITDAANLRGLGETAQYRGNPAQAEDYFRQSQAIMKKIAPGGLFAASTLKEWGDVALSRGDQAQAEEYYHQALAIQEKLTPGNKDHAETLAALAVLMRQKKEPDLAAQLYQQALTALESQTTRLGGADEDRSRFRAKYANYYTDYLDLLIAQKQPERAFEVLERSRAQTLLEMLTSAHVDIRQGVEASFVEQEHRLQDSITAKSGRRLRLLSDQHTDEQITALDQEIKKLLTQYDDVEAQIRANSPAYAALTQPQPMSTQQIQRELLDQDTLLLEYSLGKEHSYLFVVGSSSLAVYELPKRATIEQAARQVYDLLRTPAVANTNVQNEYSKAAARLSRMVLAPATRRLGKKRLLIVSDGTLHYIPFAALPSPGVPSVPLMLQHEIINLPSASVLAVLRRERTGRRMAQHAVAVLADPVFDRHDARVKNAPGNIKNESSPTQRGVEIEEDNVEESESAESLTRSVADMSAGTRETVYLPRLQLTRQEARSILAATPQGEGMSALDFQANRAMATSPSLAQYRIVHFATHGLLNNAHPELSGLVLSLVDEQGRQQNGFLGLQDIYNLNLPVDLVVLSACESGLGKNIQGEGLIGLTRGFMYAGASRVVATLWKIDDLGTAELMREFYKAIEQQGMRPAAALRAAQIKMWKQQRWSSPYYWAAFQIQGEWK